MKLRSILALGALTLALIGSAYAAAGDLLAKYQWIAVEDVFDNGSVISSYDAYFDTRAACRAYIKTQLVQSLPPCISGFRTGQCVNGPVAGFRCLQVDFGVLPGGG